MVREDDVAIDMSDRVTQREELGRVGDLVQRVKFLDSRWRSLVMSVVRRNLLGGRDG
jgi:hypothetical protein